MKAIPPNNEVEKKQLREWLQEAKEMEKENENQAISEYEKITSASSRSLIRSSVLLIKKVSFYINPNPLQDGTKEECCSSKSINSKHDKKLKNVKSLRSARRDFYHGIIFL